ncbi:putative membrane protein YkgB [Kurthia huakuii]|nr:putative membrane protein YkgB [Kurthia huakuii]
MNRLPAYLVCIVIGCLSITFGMTRTLPLAIQWACLIGGIVLNIIAVVLLYFFLQKQDTKKRTS